jgi:membrane associated rhomboid family serine protease
MGIYSRDYVRDDYGRPRFGGDGVGRVCKTIIIVTVVVFLAQSFIKPSRELPDGRIVPVSVVTETLELKPLSFLHGQVWRVVTYAFCHSIYESFPWHLLFNMLFVWWFGKTLESIYGSREFLFFYLAAAVVSGLAFVGLGLAMRDVAPAVGASGAVMAIVMVYAMYYPRQRIYIWGVIPIEIRWLVAAYVFFDLLPVLQALAGGAGRDNVAHSAHLGGLAFGFLYKKYNWRLSQFFSGVSLPNWRRMVGPRRKFRIYKPTSSEHDTDLGAKVDAVLEKISREGEQSLSDREREILKTASQRYKNR